MKRNAFKALLVAIGLSVIVASGTGLLASDFYSSRANEITAFEIAGQDLVSLAAGVLLLGVVLLSRRLEQFDVIASGLLIYVAYTYSYYAFGLLNTPLMPLYLFLAGASLYSLLGIALSAMAGPALPSGFPGRAIGIYLIVIVAVVGAMEVRDIFSRTVLTSTGLTSKGVYYVLDLAFLFPGMIIAAIGCSRSAPAGVFWSGALLIKTITLMPALILSDYLHFLNTGRFLDATFDGIALVIMVSAVAFFVLYLLKLRRRSAPGPEQPAATFAGPPGSAG